MKFKIGDIIIHKKQREFPNCEGCVIKITRIIDSCLHGFIIKFPSLQACKRPSNCHINKKYAELSYEHHLYYKMKVRRK